MLSDIYNSLIYAGFYVERIIEPDSSKNYNEPWRGLWNYYTKELMDHVPPVIIFKCRKRKEK
jgi:hypothetical protein